MSTDQRDNIADVPTLAHMPALDGLRALAVLCVLFYHAGVRFAPGGFLGVEVFFVISGFLITSLLLAEWSGHGRVDFKLFWLRRARRLLPALFLLLLSVVVFAVVFIPAEVAALRGDILSSAAYMNNWYQIVGHKSYFETAGRPSLLRHLWSLAIEEQFYVAWPVVFSLLMWRRNLYLAVWIVLTGVLASAAWMAALYQPDMDPSRVYYGTDTRVGEILIGAALAFARESSRSPNWLHCGVLNAIGCCALILLTVCILYLNEFRPFLYYGGFTLIGLTTAILIAVSVHPQANLISRALSWKPLCWVGVRSYGIYLWHFPIFVITRPQLDVPIDGAPLMFTRLTLTLLIAALSYRFVETPIRQGALGRFWNIWVEVQGKRRLVLGLQVAVASLPVAVAGCTLGLFLLNARPPAVPEYLSPVSTPATLKQDVIADRPAAVLQDMRIPVATSEAIQAPAPEAAVDTAITAIGDSVMLGVGDELKNTRSSNIVVDAEQGRLPWRTPAVVQKLRAENKINPIVILHVGNNGIFSAPVFDKLMAELKDVRKIVVVNVRVPRAWEIPNNAMLAEAVKRYPNAVLLDWKGASNDHPELFWKDGLHLRPAGARYYAALVSKLVDSDDPNRSTITIAGLVDTGRPHEQGWPSPNDAGRVRLLP